MTRTIHEETPLLRHDGEQAWAMSGCMLPRTRFTAAVAAVTLGLAALADTAVWQGGGSDTLMTTMANWQGVPASLDLTGGTLTVKIEDGTEMVYSGTTHLYHLTNAIPFVTGSDVTVTPFRLSPAAPGDKLVLANGLRAANSAQMILSGHFALPDGVPGGSAVNNNPLAIYYRASGSNANKPQGVVDGVRVRDISTWWSAPLVLGGAQIDMTVYSYCPYKANAIFCLAGTTNIMNGNVRFDANSTAVSVSTNAVIDFRGGISSLYILCPLGTANTQDVGEMRISATPALFSSGLYPQMYVRLVLDAEGIEIKGAQNHTEGLKLERCCVDFRRSRCFTNDVTQVWDQEATQWYPFQMEFNTTTQRFGIVCFRSTASTSYLHGDYPAMMEVTCQARPGAYANYVQTPTNAVPINGGLGVHVCGDGLFPLAMHNYTSCGDLEASAGTLMLCDNATWLHGTNFTARGTGCIKFTKAGQVNSAFAKLRLADSGTVEIPEGVTLEVQSLELGTGGEWRPLVSPKTFDASSGGAMAGRITGGGMLRVLSNINGFIISFR